MYTTVDAAITIFDLINSRGYYAKFEIESGLLLLLKSSMIEIAEFC